MATYAVLNGFTSGRRTRRGVPVAPDRGPMTVVAVAPGAIDRVIGARTRAERVAHLRRLRDEGTLVCRPGHGRLQHKVRGHGIPRAYIFAVDDPAAIPRIRRPPNPRCGRVRIFTV